MKIEYETLNRNYRRYLEEDGVREMMIAKCAYFKSETRGFEGGLELQDWLEAEHEIVGQRFYWFQ